MKQIKCLSTTSFAKFVLHSALTHAEIQLFKLPLSPGRVGFSLPVIALCGTDSLV